MGKLSLTLWRRLVHFWDSLFSFHDVSGSGVGEPLLLRLRGRRKKKIAAPPPWRPALEGLEPRLVPSVVVNDHGPHLWANRVESVSSMWTAGGETPDDDGPYQWWAVRAVGVPDTEHYGALWTDETSWSPLYRDGSIETLTLAFATATVATGFGIFESWGIGYVTKVQLRQHDYPYTLYTVWDATIDGPDPSVPDSPPVVEEFTHFFTATAYEVDQIRITIDTNLNQYEWEYLDAVRLFTTMSLENITEPAAENDAVTVAVNGSVDIHVLDNDTGQEEDDGHPFAYLSWDTDAPEHGELTIDCNGTLNDLSDDFFVYEPDTDYSGPDHFTYTMTDIYGGVATATVAINITSNNAPTLDTISNPSAIPEGTGIQTVNLSGIGDGDSGTQTLTVTATSSNTTLLPHPTVIYTSAQATGQLTYTPVADAFGSITVTVTVHDNGGVTDNGTDTVTKSFVVVITPINDAPTLNAISAITINEDASTGVSLSNITSGSSFESQTLTVTASSSNTALVPNPSITYSSANSTGTATIAPAANAFGSATISITVQDNGGTSAGGVDTVVRSFVVTVTSVNDAPTLNTISSPGAINEDTTATQTISLTGIGAGASNESGQALTVTATSNNTGVIPNPTVTYTSADATGNLTYAAVTNGYGSATVTVTVTDDGGTANGGVNVFTRSFLVVVTAVNDAPTLDSLSPMNISEDATTRTVSLTNITAGPNESQTLTVTALSSATAIVPNPTMTYTSPNTTGQITFTPVADANGTVTITVTVNDGQGLNNTIDRTFVVAISAINDPPTINSIAGVTINEDDGTQTVTFSGVTAGPTNESGQTITVYAVSSDTQIIYNPTVSYSNPNTSGTLTITPLPNANGAVTITVTVNDGQGLNNSFVTTMDFGITVVNDLPTLDAPVDITIPEDYGTQTVKITGISEGPANESSQSLGVTATSSNTTLMNHPAVRYHEGDSTGTLVFTAPDGHVGSTTITVTVNDGQGLNNLVSRTFVITVAAYNDPPTLDPLSSLTIPMDVSPPTRTVSLTGISSGSSDESQTLVVTALSSNTPLIPNPSVTYSSANTTGRITFTPASNQHGTVTLSVTVNDGEFFHGAITRSFTVKINEAGPVAGDDGPYTVHQGDTLLTWELGLDGLLENDTDADDDPLLITHINSDDEFAFGHPYHVSNGDLTLYDDGTFAYTPDPGFTGLQTFTYTISDGGASDTGTVSITVTNTPPVANNDSYQTLLGVTLDAEPAWFGVLGNDSDADGDELVVTEVEGHELVSGTVTLALTSGASLTLYDDGTFSYAPASGATATYNDSFEYTIFDGAAYVTATATIAVKDDIAVNVDRAIIEEDDDQFVMQVLNNDLTATGTLVVTATNGPDPGQGSVWVEDESDVHFIPAANFTGLASFTYSVSDGHGHSATSTVYVTVTPVNDAPVLDLPSNPTVDEDEYANVLSAGVDDVDVDSANVQLTFSAVSGSLTISTSYGLHEEDISGNGTSELVITASLGTINDTLAVTGGLRYRGDQDFHGTDTVTVTLDDLGNTGAGGALTDTGTFTVTVSSVNDGPVAEDDNLAANLEQTVTFWPLLNDVDADGDTLTITHLNNTSISPETSMYLGHYWATLHSNGSLTLVPDELVLDEYSFTYTVNDNHGGTDVATVTVAVGDGQWAYRVLSFSSMWGSDAYPWLAVQATGVPDTNAYGDVESTWAPEPMNGGLQTLTLSFVAPTYANGFLIRESYGNGFVTKVELLQTGNHSHATIVFDVNDSEEPDEDDSLPGSVVNLTRFFAATTVTVDAIRITIETGDEMSDEVWEEIDAVRLFGTATSNNAPSASDDTATVNEDASVIIHVLDNDSDDYDQNDRPFAYLSIATATDAPAHGTVDVVLQANGNPNNLTDYYLVYMPDADWNGDDHFTYTLTDLGGLTAEGQVTVTVNPVNDAPVAVDDYQVTSKNAAITFDPLDNDDDIDVGDEFTLSSYSQAGHGSVALDGSDLVYTPNSSFVGHDAFSYTISDGSATATAMVCVYVYESGQWATSVVAVSSEYHGEDEDEWQAEDALNAPDTFGYGDLPTGWAPEEADDGEQFIKVEFPDPHTATGLLIRETQGNGFVSRVVLSDDSIGTHTLGWEGTDPSQPGSPTDFILRFDATGFDVRYATIYIDTGTAEDGDAGWEEIDAVRLITAAGDFSGTELFTSVAEGPGAWTVSRHDNLGRPLHEEIHEGSDLRTKDYGYHADPDYLEILDETDSLGRTTRTIFDEDGNIISQILDYEDSESPGTDYVYDDQGRLLGLTDSNGNETTWVYDDEAQTSEMTDPLSNVVTTTYDDFGRAISIVDRKGRVRAFTYDHNSRLVKEEWFSNISDTTADETLRFAYNAAGQLTQASNSAGTYEYTYNASGQLTKVVEPFDVTLNFAYDDAGNRTSITDSFGGTISSTYDAGQLTSRMYSQTGLTLRIDQEFDAFGRVAEQSRYSNPDGTALVATSEYTYDASGRLTGLVHRDDDAAEIAEYGWTFDAEGQMASQTDGATTYNYTYDDQAQLTGDGTSTWAYDDSGNRTSNGGDIDPGNQLASDNDWEYTYDDEGNLIQRESDDTKWVYSWDNKNQLIQALEYDKTNGIHVDVDVKYKYDAFGNRVEKSMNGSIQRYALDGWNPAKPSPVGNENWDVLFDLSGNNNWNTLQARYLRGDAVDELFARVDGDSITKPYWYLNDHLGSTRVLFESALEIVADEISYDAWGNITAETYPEVRGRYAWTGRELDGETGLQYNRGRYYDPTVGRWISQDPIAFEAGDGNLYRYLTNQPTWQRDPSGLQEQIPQYELTKETRKRLDQLAAVPATVKNGELRGIFDGRVVLNGNEEPPAAVLEYTGPGAKNVRWLQFAKTDLVYWVQTNNGKLKMFSLEINQNIPVPIDPTFGQLVTGKVLRDGRPTSFFYHKPGVKETSIGKVSDKSSWIYDSPTATSLILSYSPDGASYPVLAMINREAQANNVNAVGRGVVVSFEAFAINTANKKVLGAIYWQAQSCLFVNDDIGNLWLAGGGAVQDDQYVRGPTEGAKLKMTQMTIRQYNEIINNYKHNDKITPDWPQ